MICNVLQFHQTFFAWSYVVDGRRSCHPWSSDFEWIWDGNGGHRKVYDVLRFEFGRNIRKAKLDSFQNADSRENEMLRGGEMIKDRIS